MRASHVVFLASMVTMAAALAGLCLYITVERWTF
jgi:hypothetical protein